MNMCRLTRPAAAGLAISISVGLAACGGGGTDGDSSNKSIAVTYSPGSVEQSYTQHFDRTYYDASSPEFVKVTATFASAPPSDVVAVRMLMGEAVFGPDPIIISAVDGSSTKFETTLSPDQMLEGGVHEGDVTLQLCRDVNCSKVVSTTGSLHYKFNVRAGLKATLKVDGVEFTNPGGAVAGTSGTQMFADLPSGSTAEFTSTVPVTWQVGGQAPGAVYLCDRHSDVTVTKSNETSTSLSIVVNNNMNSSCDLQVTATPVDSLLREASYALYVPAN
ncbi:hypothetical protein [Ideonella sp.]|uniref:hypothetical protein n=1 Tax=Ideonella sp. TaxID=1929293 RepID=UPI002B4A15CB|nr:hypothetical protein [Ideonella sp.]HJV69961.1 hypothetical protein [Ideonella sp.]